MPQLPSGRHVSFAAQSLAVHLDANAQHPRDLSAIRTTEDLFAFVDVELFRAGTPREQAACRDERPLVPGSHRLPPGLVAYASGHTLAQLDALVAQWDEDDARALREFVRGERFTGFLEGLLAEVRAFEREPPPRRAGKLLEHPASGRTVDDGRGE